MQRMKRSLSHLLGGLLTKLDIPFTLGRVFGLLPVMLLSHMTTDHQLLAKTISAYQIAMFLSTVVLYGAVQVYLVKKGIERRVFVFHMAYSSLILGLMLALLDHFFAPAYMLPPFVFLVFFRSYYLLFASYLKFEVIQSLALVAGGLVVLTVYASTLSYFAAALVALLLTLWQIYSLGYARKKYAFAAMYGYFSILRRNAGYFITFLLQQTYSQISLAAYALVAVGVEYLRATHVMYIFALAFVAHSILFRLSIATVGGSRDSRELKHHLRSTLRISLVLGLISAVLVGFGFQLIETLLFGHVTMTPRVALLLAVMVLLNSVNVGWSALFIGIRRPYLLMRVMVISTAIVLLGVVLTALIPHSNIFYYSLVMALATQTVLSTWFAVRVLHGIGSNELRDQAE